MHGFGIKLLKPNKPEIIAISKLEFHQLHLLKLKPNNEYENQNTTAPPTGPGWRGGYRDNMRGLRGACAKPRRQFI